MKKSKSLTFKENKREHELYTWTHTIQKKKKTEPGIANVWPWHPLFRQQEKKGLFSSDLVEEAAQCIRWFLNPSPSIAWPGTLKPMIRNASFIYSFVSSLSHLLSPLIQISSQAITLCQTLRYLLRAQELLAALLQMSALQTDRRAHIIIKSDVLSKICYVDAFELWCWRRLLRVPWTARRSNQSVLKEISPGISLEGMMLKLQYFGNLM